MENPQKRDEISKMFHDALCFEMEAAGIMDDKRCFVALPTMQIHTKTIHGGITLREWRLLLHENLFSRSSHRL